MLVELDQVVKVEVDQKSCDIACMHDQGLRGVVLHARHQYPMVAICLRQTKACKTKQTLCILVKLMLTSVVEILYFVFVVFLVFWCF